MNTRKIPLLILVLGWLGYQLYLALVTPLHPLLQQPIHLVFALLVVLWFYPIGKGYLRIFDFLLAVVLLGVGYYFIHETQRLQLRIPYVDSTTSWDLVMMVVVVGILLEAVRRVLGYNLLIFMLLFIAYAAFGTYFPGWLKFGGINLNDFTELMIMGPDGIFGIPLGVSANYLFYFILFGAFFSELGGGKLLIDLGLKLARSQSGGPAKAAVISSGLMGMVSGSAVANVTTTGVLTIPLMKKVGYQPEQAAAIEAVASTGGQIMPPIMGVGAFIMAEMLGVKYAKVAISATIPALIYYFSAFLLVDFLARKKRIHQKQVEFQIEPILPRLYFLIPAVVVVYYILAGASLMTAAVRGTALAILINLLRKKDRLSLDGYAQCLIQGVKQAAVIAVPTAAAGLIIGVAIHSGLATKTSHVMASVGGGNLALALLMSTIGNIILGMALPTVAAYVVSAILFVPTLIKLGVLPLAAHMFVFYFGIIAQITPPVCLASFTAAGIAGSDSWKTGWTAFLYATVAFLVPFVFVYKPGLLLVGDLFSILEVVIITLIGTFFLVGSVSGFLFTGVSSIWIRVLLFFSAVLVILPEWYSTVAGIIVGGTITVIQYLRWKRNRTIEGSFR